MLYTPEQIKKRFDSLPEEVKKVVDSPETTQKIAAVGQKHGLLLDQVADLVDETGLVILGLEKSSDYTNNISDVLGIDQQKARSIATDINTEVFDGIKAKLREEEKAAAPIEQAGGFEIEKDAQAAGKPTDDDAHAAAMTETDRINMLSDIEAPTSAAPVNRLAPQPTPAPKSEPLVDRLLSAPAGRTALSSVKDAAPQAAPAPLKPKPAPVSSSKADPYREPIE
ncbi:MAG: hypothetical protein KGI69_00020 [Patescibacteria group bacterium]|nr:hypothetical protein [Patescibacteria group bacterium]